MNVSITVDHRAFSGPEAFANWVRAQAVTMVGVNRVLIARKQVGPLYESGVRFEPERPGVESLIDALSVLGVARPSRVNPAPHTHWGDCWHLACWRCAELQETGEDRGASIRVKWRHPNFHVQVRRTRRVGQPGVDDPFVEDPSRILGMKASY